MRITKRAATVALLTAATVALSGCSTTASTTDTAGDCAPADGTVNLTFTSWIPGIEDVVDVWNEANPGIQVAVQTGPNGNGGTYANFFNQLEAGNAPDLGQIEYDALPNFRVQDGLVNLASCDGVMDAQTDFVDWTWGQVSFNEDDAVYAIPQDAGPMAMFYRADLFAANNIAIPTTWAEFATAAEQVRATGSYITNFSQSDINQFAGLVWQAGGTWFGNDGNDWSVNLTDDTSIRVADYWQDLIDRDLVSTQPPWTTEWDNAYNTGAAWTWNSAAWGANSIASGAPDTAGNWAVAPSPQWVAGDAASGNWGGSSTAVFTGSEHPYEAAKFALWLNTSSESLTLLNESANLYPAAKSGLELPVLKEGVEFYGDQAIYDVFATASSQVSPDFVWGPTMTQTYNDVSDGFKAAVSGNGTLAEALASGQTATIDALKAQSIPVKE
ncbi:sugar ABC transporter substrate-binding protein [Cryobacterium roopkundense]|uniref:Multiple sugar transport system substrate-binding protein n=1 Tax=Cryobacterium roopkundense TaxID=1001240 RepID=A0A099JB20_9MICO|nr:extracellular solute-binding protein [Cryobacterium roopkundense]KGJ74668.1 sugar ABC transporter substrate-binding protein [Cryobacterium roopkundense]MBB5640041.1 multiple sugar transport system substrate-binding protein [Cryobacterium roopkundense]